MKFQTPDLCDDFPKDVRVLRPMLQNYGGKKSFHGEIVTIKCYEDNSLVKEQASQDGHGKVMVVDGGASLRKALLGDMIAKNAHQNGWQGFIIYGCIRDVDIIAEVDIGVQALNTNPLKTEKRGLGDLNIPLVFGDVTFSPGEFVYTDNNGVIVSSKRLI